MKLHDFIRLEKLLGHPPTAKEVREYQNRPMLKSAHVQFPDPKFNYFTSVNGKLNDAEIIRYFKNQWFNLGHIKDDMQQCVSCDVRDSTIIGLN